MLSAFNAYPIVELRQRDKSKIETILEHGDRIFVGLNSGALRIYRLNERPTPQQPNPGSSTDQAPQSQSVTQHGDGPAADRASCKPTDLLREVEKFSSRAIDQLAVIREANVIISLSNYYISLYDLKNYEIIETLDRTKNASCFAVTSNIVKDVATGIPEIISRLAVAVKRRLLLWNWHDSEMSNDVSEITLAESVRSITWASATKVVCGMNSGYVVVDVLTRAVVEIVSPGAVGPNGTGSRFGAVSTAGMGYMGLGAYTPKPLATKLFDGEMLLAKDINTLFIDDEGRPLEKRQIPWPLAPEAIGYSYPYILALQPPARGLLEVRNPDTLSLMQTISLPGAAQLHIPPPTVSLAHAGKGFHISSDRCVWKMIATNYDSQVEELIQHENFDEAISVLNMLEDALLQKKTETLREVKMLKAEALFKKKKFRQAMDLMNEDAVHAPPERVLRLFPPLISGTLSRWTEQAHRNNSVRSIKKEAGSHRSRSRDGSGDASSVAHVGTGLAKLFSVGHRKTAPDSVPSTPKKTVIDADQVEDPSKSQSRDEQPLEGKDLEEAVSRLCSYLAGARTRLQRYIDPSTGKLKDQERTHISIEEATERFLRTSQTDSERKLEEDLQNTFRLVDTALFRAYMFSNPAMVGPLFRVPNFCNPDVVNEALLDQNRYMELIDFFYGKKLHKKALGLLRRFGSSAEPDEAAPSLHGPDRTIQYLKNLPASEIDLIFEHAGWTLEKNPDQAMEIFTGDTENAENLPRDKVVAFLRNLDPQFERQYLEHIINELDDMTHDFHDRLVELYVQSIAKLDNGDHDELLVKFVAFLRDSRQVYSLSKAFEMMPKNGRTIIFPWRLIDFVLLGDGMLMVRLDPLFYEAQAVVLSNRGQHRRALEIYVFKMKDCAKAQEYCNRIYKSHETALSSPLNSKDSLTLDTDDPAHAIYHTLLALYLKPPAPHQVQLQPALDLLSKHGSRLPASSTLGLISDDLPVKALGSYFRGRIRSANSLVNESRVVAGLRKAEQIAIAARLNIGDETADGQGGRSRHVTITDERHCFVCHKRLAVGMRIGGSVIAVLPDNSVVHYGCLNRALAQKADKLEAAGWSQETL